MITVNLTFRMKMRSSLGLILALALTTSVLAQFTTARMNGTVVDASGAALAGVAVTVEQVGTGFMRTTTSGRSGEFLFPALPEGQYKLTAARDEFNTYTQQGITLATNQNVTVPIQLKVGSIAQNLTVTTIDTQAINKPIEPRGRRVEERYGFRPVHTPATRSVSKATLCSNSAQEQ